MQCNRYRVTTAHRGVNLRMAVVADLHDHDTARVAVLRILERERPDVILIPGDLTEALTGEPDGREHPGLRFLREAARLVPTFYSLGNHEVGACHENVRRAERGEATPLTVHPAYLEAIRDTGTILLDNTHTTFRGMTIGGMGTGLWNKNRVPDCTWVQEFAKHNKGFKLLLCHHPEYYDRYLRSLDIDLVVAGHAHGGQWRIFGRGVYAPDQYLFPKYTSGLHEGRLLISRGTSNNVRYVPRFFNPCEVVMVHVTSDEA